MRRIGIVTENEIISAGVNVSRIKDVIDAPFLTQGYQDEKKFNQNSTGKEFQSFKLCDHIFRYDRHTGIINYTNKPLDMPFRHIVFIYGIGKDIYVPNELKKKEHERKKGLEKNLFKFKLNFSLGRFELEGDTELGIKHYLVNADTNEKLITSFEDDFMVLKNPKIKSVNKKFQDKNASSKNYFKIGEVEFEIAKILKDSKQARNSASLAPAFLLNENVPIVFSTRKDLLGLYNYDEL